MSTHLNLIHYHINPIPNVENATTDARKCVQLLMESMGTKIKLAHDRDESGDIKLPPMAWKNFYRVARALHFDNAEDAEVHHALHLLEKQTDNEEYAAMATKMREHLNYYLQMPPPNVEFEPSLLRASYQNPYVEYYNFGTFTVVVYCDVCLGPRVLY